MASSRARRRLETVEDIEGEYRGRKKEKRKRKNG
jgi:hypothetical protein